MPRNLTTKQIRQRLMSYDDAAAECVHTLVSSLWDQDLKRVEIIDHKAEVMFGFGAAIVSAVLPWLLTQFPVESWELLLPGAAYLAAMITVVCAFFSLRARAGWPALVDQALFPVAEAGGFPPRKYWTLAVHGLFKRHLRVCTRKGRLLLWAQRALMTSVAFIALTVAYGAIAHPPARAPQRPVAVAYSL